MGGGGRYWKGSCVEDQRRESVKRLISERVGFQGGNVTKCFYGIRHMTGNDRYKNKEKGMRVTTQEFRKGRLC